MYPQKLFLCLGALLFSGLLFSQNYQNGTLVDLQNNTYTGKFSIDSENALVRFKTNQSSKVFGYNQIKTLSLDGKEVVKKELDNQVVLLTSLTQGKASLFQKNKTLFYIENANGALIAVETSKNKQLLPGILNVAFQDCSSIRESISRTINFNASNLIKLTETYNNCNYSNNFELTEKEIETSNQFKSDVYWLYAGAGATMNQLTFGNTEETLVFPQFSVGILVSPGFMKSLQNKLFVGSDLSYGVASSQTLTSNTQELDVRVHSFLYTFELQYNFNTSNKVQPYLGGGANFHAERFKGTLNGERFNQTDSDLDVNLKAGVLYTLGKQRIALSFRYIPEYDSNASFKNSEGDFVPLRLENNYFITRLEFHF